MATEDNKGAGLSTSDILTEGGAQFDVVLDGTSGGQLVVPGGHMLLIAEYTREGDDLILTGPDGTEVLIQDFFGTGNPPDLVTEGGARITPEIASALAGSLAPGQYAQAEPGGAANQPIGTVDTATGSVWVLRADGSRVELQPGDPVFQGDVLEIGEDGSVGLVFIDDTVFSLDSDGRMVLDEMIFDPTTGEGESAFTVVQGVFSFVSGQVAKSGDEAMVVNTPVAIIGIRGTQVAVKAGAEGEENIITLLAEEDGTTGEIVITNAGGSQVLNVANQSSTITSYFEAPAAPVTLSQQQVDTLYGDSLSVLPDPTEYSFTGSQQDTGGGGQTGGGGEAGGEEGGEEGTGEEGAGEEGAGEEDAGDEEDELLEAVDDEAPDEEVLEEAVQDAAEQAADQGIDEDAVAAAEAAAEIAFQEALADGEDAVAAGEQAFLETLEEGAGADDVIATAAGEGEGGDTGGFGDGDDGFGTGFGGDDGFGGGDDGGLGGGLTGGDTGGDLPGAGGATIEAPPPPPPPPPTAQTPVVVAFDATGNEDSSIQINATAFTTDVDGAEVLSVRLVGLPDGAIPSFGTQLADGSYDMSGGLSGLTIQPPENFSGDFELTLVATATEVTGDTATKEQSFTMSVLPVADVPDLAVTPAAGIEDAAIALSISPELIDADGSEILSVTIAGIPDGATIHIGTFDILFDPQSTDPSDNVLLINDVTAADLAGLQITPPENFSGQFTLDIGAHSLDTATIDGQEVTDLASQVVQIQVDVDAVADTPVVTIQDATITTDEDTAIALGIDGALADTDGSGALTITIEGIPQGSVLSSDLGTIAFDENGLAGLTPDQLAGLQITPPPDSDADFTLQVHATATETSNADAADTATLALQVSVTAVADTPVVTIQDATITTDEDTAIDLNIAAALQDTDGSETLSITIDNIPDGAVLSAGMITRQDNPDGTFNITLTPAELQGLALTPPLNSDADFSLAVTATATEADGGDTATTAVQTLQVDVTAVADTPVVTIQDATITTDEDIGVALNIGAALSDADGSETLSITIDNIPDGAVLSAGMITRQDNPDGTFNITLTPAELVGLTLTPPLNSDADFSLAVTATATETSNADAATTPVQTLQVDVTAVADTPVVTIQDAIITTDEDIGVALNIGAALSDADGSETLSITIDNIPDGAVLSAGMITRQDNPDGTFNITLTPAELQGLTLTPPLNSDADFSLAVTATATETSNADAATTPVQTLQVDVTAVADTPVVTIQDAIITTDEDIGVALNIGAALSDADGSETLSITIDNIPEGAVLSTGMSTRQDNPDGSFNITLTPAELVGLTLTPPPNSDVDFSLAVTATATETDGGDAASTTQSLQVNVTAVADKPVVTVENVVGTENQPIALAITTALVDTDGSETLSVTITGIPNGAVLADGAGNPITVQNGAVTFTGVASDYIAGLTITPATGADFTLGVTSVATEADGGDAAGALNSFLVNVTGVADTPSLQVVPAAGDEDTAIDLDITAALGDTDGSEEMSITISGIPSGAVLASGGVLIAITAGVAILSPDQLQNLTIEPPSNSDADFTLGVEVTATETDGGGSASVSQSLVVAVTGVADQPDVNVTRAIGEVDETVALDITAALVDTDGSETLSVTIDNIPDGAVLSAGMGTRQDNPDGTFNITLTPAELQGLTLTPPLGDDADFTLTVTGTATEANGDTAATVVNLNVTVTGDDQPIVTVTDAAGLEDTAIALDIMATLADGTTGVSHALFMLEEDTDSILKVNPDGSITQIVTQDEIKALTGESDADMDNRGIAIDADGNVYFTEKDSDAILMKPADGGALQIVVSEAQIAALTGSSGADPKALTIGPDGKIYVADDTSDSIISFDPATSQLALVASRSDFTDISGISSVDLDGGIVINADGKLFVASDGYPNNSENAIFEIDTASGDVSTLAQGTPFTDLDVYMALAPNGDIIVADDGTDTIYRVDANDGTVTTFLSEAQLESLVGREVDLEGGIAFDAFGNFYVAEENSDNVYSWPVDDLAAGTIDASAGALFVSENDIRDAIGSGADLEGGIAFQGLGDGEILSISISDIPDGAVLSAGMGSAVDNGDGTFSVSLTPEQLEGLTITPPEDSNQDFTLTVTATATDALGNDTVTTASLNVDVTGVADTPTLSADLAPFSVPVIDGEGGLIYPLTYPLDIDTALTDTDSSETLSIKVSGVPEGASLSNGTDNGDGTYTLTPNQLASLSLLVTAAVIDDFNLTITSTAAENDGDTASEEVIVPVPVPDADSEFVYGTAGSDTIDGGGGDDVIYGFAGDDHLHSQGGGDILFGGEGSDHLKGGGGADFLMGGAGEDHLDGGGGADILLAVRATMCCTAKVTTTSSMAAPAMTCSRAGMATTFFMATPATMCSEAKAATTFFTAARAMMSWSAAQAPIR